MPASVFEPTKEIDAFVLRAQLRVGTTVREKWRMEVLLGVGGMAAVYAATHRNGSRAAIKVLHPELCTHSDIRSRFLREGYVANRIGHSGAVRVIDDDVTEDGAPYLVMELLDGESLEDRRVRLGGKLGVDEVLSATDQVLDVLAAAHDKGIVHRDIKPENIFLTREGVVKLLDFGIARLRELSSPTMATITGVTMGTPCYMSPEHARGIWDDVDAQSDLWSVGATMFSLIAGRVVHDARTPNEALVSAMTKAAPSVRTLAPDVPEPAERIVDKALAFAKTDRWPDARAMQHALREAYEALHNAPISSCPPLSVPPSVVDRTLPSEGIDVPRALLAPTTGGAGAVGRTAGSRTLAGIPRTHAFVLIGAAGLVGFVLLVVVVVRVAAWRVAAVPQSPASDGSVAAEPATELPTAAVPTSAPSTAPSSTPAIPAGERPAPSTTAKPAPSAAPRPQQPSDWKERRK